MSADFEVRWRPAHGSENDYGPTSALTAHRKIALDSNVLIYLIETRGALAEAAASIVESDEVTAESLPPTHAHGANMHHILRRLCRFVLDREPEPEYPVDAVLTYC